MNDVIARKIEELKSELAKQVFTADDKAEIDKTVEDYRKELTEEKENEYAYNRVLIEAKIDVLNEALVEIKEEETKSAEEVSIPANPTISM